MANQPKRRAPAKKTTSAVGPPPAIPTAPQGTGVKGGGYAGPTSAVGGAAGDSNINTQNPTTAYANTPAYALTPQITPGAWGINSPSETLFTGSDAVSSVSPNRLNRLIGDIMDRIGYQPGPDELGGNINNHNFQISNLAKYLGVTMGKGATGQQTLREIAGKLGLPAHTQGADLWGAIAEHLGVTTDQTIIHNPKYDSITNIASSFLHMDSGQIKALQAQLWQAGMYDPSAYEGKSLPTPGNLDPLTQKAIGTMLNYVSEANTGTGAFAHRAPVNRTWQQMLGQLASTAATASGESGLTIDALLSKDAGTGTPTVTQATTAQLFDPLRAAMQSVLGRLPSESELQLFTTQYDQAQQANSKYINPNLPMFPDSDTGVSLEPGVPRPSYAAQAFASSDPVEYQAHNIANAGALMLNAIKSGGGLGQQANLTSSG